MPLIILGLIVIAGIVIYALVRYANSDEQIDMRPVRERYSHVFEKMKENMRKGANYEVVEDDDDSQSDDAETGGSGHTMHFPDDAEVEKRKRNIR